MNAVFTSLISLIFTVQTVMSVVGINIAPIDLIVPNYKEVYNYYSEFGVTDKDLDSAEVKPVLSLSKIVVPANETSKVQQVQLSVSGAHGKYCNTGIHIFYDKRLSIEKRANGSNNIICNLEDLVRTSKSCDYEEDEMPGVFLSTGGSGDFGTDGPMWTINFVLPDDAKEGDVYPLDIKWMEDGVTKDTFYDKNRAINFITEYTFIRGIYNKYNPYEGDEYLPAGSTYDGYIAVGAPAPEDKYYDDFDVNDSDLNNAEVKPVLTLNKIVVPEDETSNIQRVELSVSGADLKYCTTGIHLNFDKRLKIATDDAGINKVECKQNNLMSSSRLYEPENSEMSGIVLATGGKGDYGTDGVIWTIDFVLPNDAKAGDVYPLDILFTEKTGAYRDCFWDYNVSKNYMNEYTFIRGIYNKYNPYEGDEYLPAGSTFDGYIAIDTPASSENDVIYGDANCDGKVEIADATLILQFLTNKDEYFLTVQGLINADVCGNHDGVTAQDALTIQQVDAGIYKIEDLPI